jgi:hypothetical protein
LDDEEAPSYPAIMLELKALHGFAKKYETCSQFRHCIRPLKGFPLVGPESFALAFALSPGERIEAEK